MGRGSKIARRTFLIGSVAVAGGVAFGVWRYRTPYPNPLFHDLPDGAAALTPYVRIDQAGITIIAPRAEMGQGVHTTLAALVAEELDVGLEDVTVEHGPASRAYFNALPLEEGLPYASIDASTAAERARSFADVPMKLLGIQITGGSTSTPDGFIKMRKAGAAARLVLLQAAAQRLGVPTSTLSTASGAVVGPDGTRVPYTELAVAAAMLDVPDDPPLKPQSEWRLLGRSLPRVDMVSKCTGTAEYSIDIHLPGMLYATVRMNPNLGAGMISYDASVAESMSGVEKIIPLDGGIAVVATNTWYAFKAANAVSIDWDDASYPPSSAEHFAAVEAAFDDRHDRDFRDDGDVDAAFVEGSDVQGEYRVPYLAHATMEPLNAVALLEDGRLDVWTGTQAPTQVAKDGAAIANVSIDDVHVHTTYMGGGFGRRSETDYVQHAVQIASVMEGVPIKMTWSREEDMTHDAYRPLAIARFDGSVGDDGRPHALHLRLSAPSVTRSQIGRMGFPLPIADPATAQSAWDQPYDIPHYRVGSYDPAELAPITSWRSVGASQNGFFHECAIDELAHAAGTDPLEMRLAMMNHDPSRKVLDAAAEMSSWGRTMPEGHALGVAFVMSFGVPVAEVFEVADTPNGIRIVKAWAAVDVGTALDPRNIEAQVQSGINFGLAAAIMGEITIANGRVEQKNYHQFDAIRMRQAPDIEVKILENGDRIRGIGEPGTPPAAPALANAIFAATGRRIRELPLRNHIDFA